MKKTLFILPILTMLLGGCDLGAIIGGDDSTSFIPPTIPVETSSKPSTATSTLPPSSTTAPAPNSWSYEDRLFLQEHFYDANVLPYAYSLDIQPKNMDNYVLALNGTEMSYLINQKIDDYSVLLGQNGFSEYSVDFCMPTSDFLTSRAFRKNISTIPVGDYMQAMVEIFVCVGNFKNQFGLLFTKNYYMVDEDGTSSVYYGTEEFKNIQSFGIEYLSYYAIDPNEPEAAASIRASYMPIMSFDIDTYFLVACMSYKEPFSYGNSASPLVYEEVLFAFSDPTTTLLNTMIQTIIDYGFDSSSPYIAEECYSYSFMKDINEGTWNIRIDIYTDSEGTPIGMDYAFSFTSFSQYIPEF